MAQTPPNRPAHRIRIEREQGRWLRDILADLFVRDALPVKDIAAQLGIHPSTVRYWIRQYALHRDAPHCPTCGRRIPVRRATLALEAFPHDG